MLTMKPRTIAIAALTILLTWAPLYWIAGCSGAKSPEECSDEALAEIEARCATKLLAACAGKAETIAQCADADPIIAECDAQRKDWQSCR